MTIRWNSETNEFEDDEGQNIDWTDFWTDWEQTPAVIDYGWDDAMQDLAKSGDLRQSDFLSPNFLQKAIDALKKIGGKAADFASSPQGIMSLIGAAANAADRQKPSGGGTTMAYQGPAELKRKMVQGPYGPVAEYEGVGGGAPDYTRFSAPTVAAPAPAPEPDYEELLKLFRSVMPAAAPAAPAAAPAVASVATPAAAPVAVSSSPKAQPNVKAQAAGATQGGTSATPITQTLEDNGLVEQERVERDPQQQQKIDSYMKQVLPTLLEDVRRTGTYTDITNLMVKYGFTEADVNRVFGSSNIGDELKSQINAGNIMAPIIGYGGSAFAHNKASDMTYGASAPALGEFDVPEYITKAYGLIGAGPERKEDAQAPAWLDRYRSPSVTKENLGLARDTAIEFAKVYGREITPAELDNFVGASRANIIYNMGLDPKDFSNYTKAIAPARDETLKKIVRNFETGRGGYLTDSDMISLGLGQYKNIQLTPQETLEALNSGSPDQYIQQRARMRGKESFVGPKTKVFGEVAGMKLTAPEREPMSKSLGGVGIGSLPDLIQYYNLNDEELGQLENLMRSSGDEKYATQIQQLRTGTLPAPSWGHADWQNKTTADFFGVTGTPEAESYVFQGAFKPLIEQASGLTKIGYRPGIGLAAGPEKPTAQQASAAAVGTPYETLPLSQTAPQVAQPRDLKSMLPSEWGTYTGAEGAQKKIDWFNQQKATQAELERAGVTADELAWMRQNKLGTYAQGGPVRMEDGGFVMTKRAVDGAGGPRGIQQLVPGARMIRGPGHGTSDSIPAYIQGRNGRTPARLSNGEAYVPPGQDTDKLYALMKSLERNA